MRPKIESPETTAAAVPLRRLRQQLRIPSQQLFSLPGAYENLPLENSSRKTKSMQVGVPLEYDSLLALPALP
jgi:hypothetical protein